MQAECRLADGLGSDFIGHIEDALLRSEVAFELNRRSVGIATDVLAQAARIRPPEAVDGLGFIADDSETLSARGQQPDDVHLEAVQVLILVHQYVAKTLCEVRAQLVVAHQGTPIEKEIIEIEEGGAALAGGEIPEELADDLEVRLTPRVLQWHEFA